MNRMQFIAALAALPLAGLGTAWAQDRPMQIIVPFGPGGSGDISARMFADYLHKKTGRNVIVDNRAGGNGIIGVEAVKNAPADGSVLLLATTSTHLANPSLFHKLPYDPARDFRLVGSFGLGSTFVLVRPDSPHQNLADFVKAAKAAPGKLNYGHFNAASNVTAALFNREAGINVQAIPYKQVAQALTELIAGRIEVVFIDTVAGDAMVASGQLRALAVHADARLKRYPAIPLLIETFPKFSMRNGFLGVAVAAATPLDTQHKLNALVNDAVSSEPMKGKLESFGFSPARYSLAELAAFEREERDNWKRYVDIAKIEIQ